MVLIVVVMHDVSAGNDGDTGIVLVFYSRSICLVVIQLMMCVFTFSFMRTYSTLTCTLAPLSLAVFGQSQLKDRELADGKLSLCLPYLLLVVTITSYNLQCHQVRY